MKSVGELGKYGPLSFLSHGHIKYVEDNCSPYKRFTIFQKNNPIEKSAILNDEGVLKGVSYMDVAEYDNPDDIALAEHIKQYVNTKQFHYENSVLRKGKTNEKNS
tara:strand:+ start:67 stop:381 length:315 start_codon:yes stop_codon:yes gene_type:complete